MNVYKSADQLIQKFYHDSNDEIDFFCDSGGEDDELNEFDSARLNKKQQLIQKVKFEQISNQQINLKQFNEPKLNESNEIAFEENQESHVKLANKQSNFKLLPKIVQQEAIKTETIEIDSEPNDVTLKIQQKENSYLGIKYMWQFETMKAIKYFTLFDSVRL